MDWTHDLQNAIRFIENHLLDDISSKDIADEIHMSSFYFQKGFKIMTGYSPAEYIRNRRLYLAALDAASGNEKIIDLALKYGYDTPESFTKAYSRFHGISPLRTQNHSEKIKPFLPLKIIISIQGGYDMDYVTEKVKGFQVIGFEREISYETSYQDIPKFWDEFCRMYMKPLFSQEEHREIQQAISNYNIGEYGICIDSPQKGETFRYLIAGAYDGKTVPDGLVLYEFPEMEWMKFRCTGPLPGSLQSVNTKIFHEWLPNNQEYDIAMDASIEWYSEGDTSAADYRSEIWIPVKRK
ncbi:helix-turn-helix domain-containing protein [Clostridium sp. MCC353]|uniref:AraC family transcriptional regulator n=1 Tax=Clostridium sp. MCC353 TaxID=2592646 RepID=UPI001C026060|nr:AraC family transcriptional regulator [Clostridium sp. MCC353]MBT9775999.1 helix-turn-helix domain-containing protein [Clostridium sp. MCC353]